MPNVRESTQSKANGMANEFKNRAQNLGEQISSAAEHAGERVGTLASNVADTTMETVRTSEKYVQEHPVKGVAIAAATGFVIGSLFTMAMRSKRRD